MPSGDAAVVCMDGFDLIQRRVIEEKCFAALVVEFSNSDPLKSPVMLRFIHECSVRKLPLNEGKQVVKALNAVILGGELDGITGVLLHERSKSAKLAMRTLALLSIDVVSQASVQHWAGLFLFRRRF